MLYRVQNYIYAASFVGVLVCDIQYIILAI